MAFEVVLANFIVCLAGFVQASVGIGFAMIAVPLLVVLDPIYAPGPSLFVMLFLGLAMVAGAWREIDRQGLWSLFPGLGAGTIAGAFALGALAPSLFEPIFGGIVLSAIVIGQLGVSPGRSRAAFGVGGFIAGLMGTISGIHGPPLAVLYSHGEPAQARATIAFIFVIASILSLATLHVENLFGRAELIAGLALIPGLIAGYAMAQMGRNLISDNSARQLMLTIAAISAAILIGKSVL